MPIHLLAGLYPCRGRLYPAPGRAGRTSFAGKERGLYDEFSGHLEKIFVCNRFPGVGLRSLMRRRCCSIGPTYAFRSPKIRHFCHSLHESEKYSAPEHPKIHRTGKRGKRLSCGQERENHITKEHFHVFFYDSLSQMFFRSFLADALAIFVAGL
ncbi:hypothetical protein [Alistipes senegalensis]|uniref:hypothetical protein n=1 Tax=Alistipes senegalensis TaxID=1288121 RepID=UPI00242B73F4|nr:hypothetical protein [Alistipes senegalensis]